MRSVCRHSELFNFGNGVLSANGDTKRPLTYLTIAGILNVLFNLLFVIVCGMVEDGVALASIITQYVSAALILMHMGRQEDDCAFRLGDLKNGSDKAEGNSAAANADAIIYNVMAAFYTACSTFMGQNLGAGKRDRVLKSYLVGVVYSFAAGAVLGGMLFLFGREFMSLFANEEDVIEAGL